MREQVAHLHTELARRYAGKPQPAAERELDAAEQAISLWHGLWEQYSACLKPLLEGDVELQGVKAKLLQRGLYVGKQLVIVYGLARRVPPPTLWQELHAYYRLAEMLDCAVTAVSDELQPHAVGISCYSTYCHALLLGLADPCALSVRQIELADRWLASGRARSSRTPQQRETEGPVIAHGPRFARSAPAGSPRRRRRNAPVSMRYGYPGKLATQRARPAEAAASGRHPGRTAARHDTSRRKAPRALLAHLDARWYQLPQRDADARARRPSSWPPAACRPPISASAAARSTARIRSAASRSRARSTCRRSARSPTTTATRKTPSELAVGTVAGRLRLARREAHAARCHAATAGSSTSSWSSATTERTRLGYVTRVASGRAGRARGLARGCGRACRGRFAMRPTSVAFAEELPLPALHAGGDRRRSRRRWSCRRARSTPGRMLRSMDTGPERKFRLTRLLQRGGDFERVAFDES